MPRTEGISSTDILGRILDLDLSQVGKFSGPFEKEEGEGVKFLNTATQMGKFMEDLNPPRPGQKIVYVDGSFDLLTTGHVEFLRRAKEDEDAYVIAGVYSDQVINPLIPRFAGERTGRPSP